MLLIAILFLLPDYAIGQPTSGEYTETCISTQFASKNDALKGGATPYLMKIRPEDPYVRPTDVGVAHRTLPFGTTVEISLARTGKTTRAIVLDRGPFGRLDEDGNWYNGAKFYRRHKGGKIPSDGWVGCADLTPPVVKALGHNGKETVTLRVVEWPEINS